MTHNPDEDLVERPDEADAVSCNPEVLEDIVQPKQASLTAGELGTLMEEMRSYKDKYLRSLADSENLRKRMLKEKEDYSRYCVSNAVADFLHPLDNLENALGFADNMSDEVKNWAIGFQMILAQFKEALASNGVTPIPALGKPFDPHLHEAVETVETNEQPPGIILQEFTRGYMMGDKTIRPSRVKVSRKPKNNSEAATEELNQ